jgi:hypothetical protein
MVARQITQANLKSADYSLGGFDWIDCNPKLWPFFARLVGEKQFIISLYQNALVWPPAVSGKVLPKLINAVERLADKLPKRSSRDQLALVLVEAQKLGLNAADDTRKKVEDEVRLFLTSEPRPEYDPLLKASPWPTAVLVEEHIGNQVEALIPVQYYQHDSKQPADSPYNLRMDDCRMALEAVMSSFYFCPERVQEIPSPIEQGKTVRVETSKQLYIARRYAFDAARNMNRFGRGPRDTGPRRLAKFITAFMGKKHWPRQPAGLPFDPITHFNDEHCRAFVRKYLGLPEDAAIDDKQTEAWHLYSVTVAILYDHELRNALLQLADDADRPKRDKNFRSVLTTLFQRISAALEPGAKSKLNDLVLFGADKIRRLRADGRSEKDIVRKAEVHLGLRNTPSGDKGGTLDTYFRDAWKKTSLGQPKRRTKARSADTTRRSLR